MSFRSVLRKFSVWLLVIILLSMDIVFTAWFFQLVPEYVLRFALAPLIALFLTVLLASREKYRLQFRELLKKYGEFQKREGLLYKYGRALNAITLIALLTVSVILYYNPGLQSIEYIPYAGLALFVAFPISTIAYICGLLRIAGKWGLLFLTILAIIVILRFILR
jgi:hypothetical protein